jgi:pilus assembly protein CpaF
LKDKAVQTAELYAVTTRHFLSPIRSLLEDPQISEILINGHETIYFEREGRLFRSELIFPNSDALDAAAQNIAEYVNRHVDADHHSMDARLPDGSRVHVIVAPSSRQGTCISIRKFKKSSFDLDVLVNWGSLTAEAAEFLRMVVLLHKNTVISGGTGTGKTSMLNALSAAIPDHERIIVIEDSSELQLKQPHTVYLEAQPRRPDGRGEVTIRDLFVDSLRMRPDRIVVGEVRRGEALDLIQSMISGHAGSLTTVHANTPRDAAIRLETLCLMSDVSLPVYVARAQVASALHVVVQISRFADGTRRVFTISEVKGLDSTGTYRVQDLYHFQARGRDETGRIVGELVPTGASPGFSSEPFEMGYGSEVQLTSNLFQPAVKKDDEQLPNVPPAGERAPL